MLPKRGRQQETKKMLQKNERNEHGFIVRKSFKHGDNVDMFDYRNDENIKQKKGYTLLGSSVSFGRNGEHQVLHKFGCRDVKRTMRKWPQKHSVDFFNTVDEAVETVCFNFPEYIEDFKEKGWKPEGMLDIYPCCNCGGK